MALEGQAQHTPRYRINPKVKTQVEWQRASGRWQTLQVCKSPQDAKALLFRLINQAEERK